MQVEDDVVRGNQDGEEAVAVPPTPRQGRSRGRGRRGNTRKYSDYGELSCIDAGQQCWGGEGGSCTMNN